MFMSLFLGGASCEFAKINVVRFYSHSVATTIISLTLLIPPGLHFTPQMVDW